MWYQFVKVSQFLSQGIDLRFGLKFWIAHREVKNFMIMLGAKPAFYWWIKKKYNGVNVEKNKKG